MLDDEEKGPGRKFKVGDPATKRRDGEAPGAREKTRRRQTPDRLLTVVSKQEGTGKKKKGDAHVKVATPTSIAETEPPAGKRAEEG